MKGTVARLVKASQKTLLVRIEEHGNEEFRVWKPSGVLKNVFDGYRDRAQHDDASSAPNLSEREFGVLFPGCKASLRLRRDKRNYYVLEEVRYDRCTAKTFQSMFCRASLTTTGWLARQVPSGAFHLVRAFKPDVNKSTLAEQLRTFHAYLERCAAGDKEGLRVFEHAADIVQDCAGRFGFRAALIADIEEFGIRGIEPGDVDHIVRCIVESKKRRQDESGKKKAIDRSSAVLDYTRFREFPLKCFREVASLRTGTTTWYVLESLSRAVGISEPVLDCEYLLTAMTNIMNDDGHMCLPVERVASLLEKRGVDWRCVVQTFPNMFVVRDDMLFIKQDYDRELHIARELVRIATSREQDQEDHHEGEETKAGTGSLTDEQWEAVHSVLGAHRVTLVTGFPGTGKTKVIATVYEQFAATFGGTDQCLFLAPTGKAAARLREVLVEKKGHLQKEDESLGVMTIHAAVHAKCESIAQARLVVVDEMSMVDATLFHELVSRCSSDTRLLLVGDPHQLPSIGRGDVFRQLLTDQSGLLCIVRLTKVFRQQGSGSKIWDLAQTIRDEGKFTHAMLNNEAVTWKKTFPDDDINVVRQLVELYRELDGDLLILVPMNVGKCGVVSINAAVHASTHHEVPWCSADNPIHPNSPDDELFQDDRVLVTKNGMDDNDQPFHNGMLGTVSDVYERNSDKVVSIVPDGTEPGATVQVDREHVTLGYAMTVHKSQGSESHNVALVMTDSHTKMLTRELAYTAVTRAKKQLYLFASKEALKAAREKPRPHRHTLLAQLIRERAALLSTDMATRR